MKKIFFLFCLCFFSQQFLFSQTENWMVAAVEFEGLEKTKEKYLRQFLKLRKGGSFTTIHLQNDIQQLWNVGTNHQISARVDTLTAQEVRVTFILKEKKTLLPILNFGGISDNLWWQLGTVDFNWLGRGHQFLAYYQNTDGRNAGQIYYRIPFLNKKWGAAVDLLQWRSKEPLYFSEGIVTYEYDNINFGLTAIRNFGFRKRLEFGVSIFQEKYQKSEEQLLDNPPGPDNLTLPKFSPKIEYVEDYLNYQDFYLHGWTWRGIWQTVYNGRDQSFFNSLILELRKFHRLGKNGNFALRGRFGISTNDDTPFAPFVVDSRINLRGSGNRIERGTGQAILNMEYRHTFLNSQNFALQGVVFSDLGNWRSPGGKLHEFIEREELRHFVGGGFRVIYKNIYGAILRVDYGVDIYNRNQRGIVIGLGQYF